MVTSAIMKQLLLKDLITEAGGELDTAYNGAPAPPQTMWGMPLVKTCW